jgi:hypothetical protein
MIKFSKADIKLIEQAAQVSGQDFDAVVKQGAVFRATDILKTTAVYCADCVRAHSGSTDCQECHECRADKRLGNGKTGFIRFRGTNPADDSPAVSPSINVRSAR